MSILNITRLPISLFPMSRTAAAEAFNSIARIKKYLLLPELIGVREIERTEVIFCFFVNSLKSFYLILL